MPLVVNTICRFSFIGTNLDRPFVNIMDMHLDTTGSGISREDWIYDCAGNAINSWVEHIAPIVSNNCQLQEVAWVDLNSQAGSTGRRVATSEHTLPVSGGVATQSGPGNISVLVTKQVVASRGRRNGRWYQAGLPEPTPTGNELTGGALTNWSDAFDGFLAEMNETSPLEIGERDCAVVHTTGENPQTGTYSIIDQMVVAGRLATQRRRLRG